MKPAELAEAVAALPMTAGVYLLKDSGGRVLYVGKAANLRSRVRSYLDDRAAIERPHLAPYLKRWRDVQVILTSTVAEALVLENSFIKKERPPANVRLRDDKRYLCLRIDLRHQFPRITLVRRFQRDGALYFGPYVDAKALRQTLRAIRELFPLRSCTDHTLETIAAPCLYWQLGRCAAPCHDHVTKARYDEIVTGALDLLRGRRDDVLADIRRRMVEESEAMRFENAALLRDRLQSLERTLERQRVAVPDTTDRDVLGIAREGNAAVAILMFIRDGAVVSVRDVPLPRAEGTDADVVAAFLGQFYDAEKYVPPEVLVPELPEDAEVFETYLSELRGTRVEVRVPQRGAQKDILDMARRNAELALQSQRTARAVARDALVRLAEMARLPAPPEVVECFDVSHLQGEEVVASMVRCVDGRMDRSGYRHYRIRENVTNDDFGSMNEILRRRYRVDGDERLERPDLIVVDGGKGQLSSARAALAEVGWPDAPIVGLAKARANRDGIGRFERIFLPHQDDPVVPAPDAAETLLLTRMRDEAHRFAITYHRKVRSQMAVESALDAITGVGDRWRRELLQKFGSVQGIRDASIDDLLQVPGLGRTRALRILEHLREP
ncbi:MAG: excinuclease ABC subunit UvrC [Planctomycetes bacterium]|nr:excinuclease ABC subunit UvrC [Planctomycetota bacterium]